MITASISINGAEINHRISYSSLERNGGSQLVVRRQNINLGRSADESYVGLI